MLVFSLDGGQEVWPPPEAIPGNVGWNPGDAAIGGNAESAGWNPGDYPDNQPVDDEDPQDGWAGDEGAPEVDEEEWNNEGQWGSPDGNAANLEVSPPPADEQNGPPPGWNPQQNGDYTIGQVSNGGGAWTQGQDGQQWVSSQQGQQNNGVVYPPSEPVQQNGEENGWASPQPVPQGGGNGWATNPQNQPGGGGAQGGWPASNGGKWSNPQPPSSNVGGTVTWENAVPEGGWVGGQQNVGGYNPNVPDGSQDPALSWKVYNEDTQTMENLDDDSGWKIVGDGGPDGWKLVNENGNIEWKIENVNGEWRVISADDLPAQNNRTSEPLIEDANATTASPNITSDIEVTANPAPSWDDAKQGRYVVWKFSEDGKGEARVYNGDGAEPVVWTVGNNQYWNAAEGLNPSINVNNNNNNGKVNWVKQQAGVNSNSGSKSSSKNRGWNGNNGNWQNSGGRPPQNNGWQADGGGTGPRQLPSPQTGWPASGPTANTGASWQTGQPSGQNIPPSNTWKKGTIAGGKQAQRGTGWQAHGQVPPGSSGFPPQQAKGKGWQSGNKPPPNSWKKGVTPPKTNASPNIQANGGWQNQPPVTSKGWNRGNVNPSQSSGGWQNKRPANQVPPPQTGWKNGGTSPQSNTAFGPRGNIANNQRKAKGKKKGRNPSTWQSNKSSNNGQGLWSNNNKNGGTSWNQGKTGPTPSGNWNQPVEPITAPPTANSDAGTIPNWQSGGTNGGWPGGPPITDGKNVPYIIVIKQSDDTAPGGASNSWPNKGNNPNAKRPKNRNGNKPRNNRRGFKMNPAGSSGWQWNPQGNGGWKWNDGWMGSGGGYGGWVNDKNTMYSAWRPSQTNTTPTNVQKPKRPTRPKPNKKNGGKMVLVFGSKKNQPGNGQSPVNNGGKRGKQVVILDYTGGKGTDVKDIESLIQALRYAKASNSQGNPQGTATWKRKDQPQSSQQGRQ
ncbi:hypothetical protein JTE90_000662 [Oedothorax gibbosus]|uniref:Uncharacterized protein n=1 Tax=Oedothorax gibbosus TaxID=931172 RepID=A0AAV6VWJ5_9ARAC|nr:hypothetical protein JTE90_000662 [Oedothorax gibbosus]